jgi:hypothetical protein
VDAEARGYLEKIQGGLSAPERSDLVQNQATSSVMVRWGSCSQS